MKLILDTTYKTRTIGLIVDLRSKRRIDLEKSVAYLHAFRIKQF